MIFSLDLLHSTYPHDDPLAIQDISTYLFINLANFIISFSLLYLPMDILIEESIMSLSRYVANNKDEIRFLLRITIRTYRRTYKK